MKELYEYKYLSLEFKDLDNQLKDALKKFKIDFKNHIVENPQNQQVNDEKLDNNSDSDSDNNSEYTDESDESIEKISNNLDDSNNSETKDNENEKLDNEGEKLDEENENNKGENNSNTEKIGGSRRKKKRKRKVKIENLTNEDKIMLRIYKKLSKILHPDKNPLCSGLFLKMQKYYEEKNLMELVIIANLFDIDIDDLEIETYNNELNKLRTNITNIKNNAIWLLYYGNESQRNIIRQKLYHQLNK